jgi:hypothetical protein
MKRASDMASVPPPSASAVPATTMRAPYRWDGYGFGPVLSDDTYGTASPESMAGRRRRHGLDIDHLFWPFLSLKKHN